MMRMPSWLLIAALALAAVFACHGQRNTRFPHELHLTRLECGSPGQPPCLTCSGCHGTPEHLAPASLDPQLPDARRPGPKRPDATVCSPCHADHAELLLERSVRPPTEPTPTAYQIHFDHQRHLTMTQIKGQCVPCHSGAVQQQSALFPPMENCFECHEHERQWQAGQCAPCHDAEQLRRLVPRTFARHDRGFLRAHGNDARNHPELCTSCHTQQQCDDCHDMTQVSRVEERHPDAWERQFTHPPGFINHHALEARSLPGRCLTCHTPQTCDGCHLQQGVSGAGLASASPHPPGWAFGNPASRDFHGRAARRDLLSCVSCHDQGPATNCIDCHRVGAAGGNPHPRGQWSSRSPDQPMCRYCHVR